MLIAEVAKLWQYLGFTKIKCRTTLHGQLCFIAQTKDCSFFLPMAEVRTQLPNWKIAFKQHVKNFNWETNLPEYEN